MDRRQGHLAFGTDVNLMFHRRRTLLFAAGQVTPHEDILESDAKKKKGCARKISPPDERTGAYPNGWMNIGDRRRSNRIAIQTSVPDRRKIGSPPTPTRVRFIWRPM